MPSILLIEDDDSIRSMYGFALKREGYDVVQVADVTQAMDQVQERHFDVILLDMLLGEGMSGLDFLRNYNVQVESPQTKVVGLSNIDSEAVIEKARGLGVENYLNKANTEPAQVVTFLQQLLGGPVTSTDGVPVSTTDATPPAN